MIQFERLPGSRQRAPDGRSDPRTSARDHGGVRANPNYVFHGMNGTFRRLGRHNQMKETESNAINAPV